MESDSSVRVEIPANFEGAPVDYLVQLNLVSFLFHISNCNRRLGHWQLLTQGDRENDDGDEGWEDETELEVRFGLG